MVWSLKSREARFFKLPQTVPKAYKMAVRFLSWRKSGQDAKLTIHPSMRPRSNIGRAALLLYHYVGLACIRSALSFTKKNVDFANLMLNANDDDDIFFTASNEANFHMHGHVNRHSGRVWEQEQSLKSMSLCETARKLLSSVVKGTVKGKEVPLQAWSGPEGSRMSRFLDFVTTQDGSRFSALRTSRLYRQEILLVLISVRG